jgi:hypothetical protein
VNVSHTVSYLIDPQSNPLRETRGCYYPQGSTGLVQLSGSLLVLLFLGWIALTAPVPVHALYG